MTHLLCHIQNSILTQTPIVLHCQTQPHHLSDAEFSQSDTQQIQKSARGWKGRDTYCFSGLMATLYSGKHILTDWYFGKNRWLKWEEFRFSLKVAWLRQPWTEEVWVRQTLNSFVLLWDRIHHFWKKKKQKTKVEIFNSDNHLLFVVSISSLSSKNNCTYTCTITYQNICPLTNQGKVTVDVWKSHAGQSMPIKI